MRRIVAIVIPRLACEVARQKLVEPREAPLAPRSPKAHAPGDRPLAVILEPEGGGSPTAASATLDVVDDEARRLGLITVGDLARMPRAEVQARIGDRAGEVLDLAVGRDELFAVAHLRFVMRLDRAEWWNQNASARDYVRAWLSSGDGAGRLERLRSIELAPGARASKAGGAAGEALLYFDRKTREAFLQGWCE